MTSTESIRPEAGDEVNIGEDYEEHLYDRDPGRVVIAFAGGPQNVYQWSRTLRSLRRSHVLVRDMTQCYHANGVRGIGDRRAVLEWIQRWTFVCQVTTVGVSSGAYAALLYGQLAPVQEVVAISPLTGREVDDFAPEWHSQIIDPAQPHMDDLRKYFKEGPRMNVRAFISDGYPTCTLDRQMCTRINIPESSIHLIPGYEHGELARGMRDRGMLRDLLS